jgi:hypothetical protein
MARITAEKNATRQRLVVIFPSYRPPCTTQICVFLADLLDPKLDPTDLCSLSTSYTDFLHIFYVRSSPTGEDLNNFYFFECGPANNQPAVKMVAPDYYEED